MLWAIAAFYLYAAPTFSSCEELFSSAESTPLIEEFVEADSESTATVYRLRTADSIVEHSKNKVGFIQYVIDSDVPGEITIDFVYGSPKQPGLGSFLKAELRRHYPKEDFVSSLQMLNGQRLLRALRANPDSPNFSQVPSISSLGEDFELNLHLVRDPHTRRVNLIDANVRLKARTGPNGRWLNQDEVTSSELYQDWIAQGAPSSLIDSWEPPALSPTGSN